MYMVHSWINRICIYIAKYHLICVSLPLILMDYRPPSRHNKDLSAMLSCHVETMDDV